jgi:hypothetical protein
MLAATDLNDEAIVEADEVSDIGTKGVLSPEMCAGEPVASQFAPQASFGIGHLAAKSTREIIGLGADGHD